MRSDQRVVEDVVWRAEPDVDLEAWMSPVWPDLGPPAHRVAELQQAMAAIDTDKAVDRQLRAARRLRRWVGACMIGSLLAILLALATRAAPTVYWSVGRVVGGGDHVTVRTGVGELRSVRFPNGSRATLAPESRVEYRTGFGRSNAVIQVEGDVRFDVAPGANAPVEIDSPRAAVLTDGGEIEVQAYPDDPDVRVAVTSGTARVAATRNVWQAVKSGTTAHIVAGRVLLSADNELGMLSWSGDSIRFNDVPASDALAVLRHWMGGDLRIGDPILAGRRVTMVLSPAGDWVRELSDALGATIVRTRAGVLLYLAAAQ